MQAGHLVGERDEAPSVTVPIVLGVFALVVILFIAYLRRAIATQWGDFKYTACEIFHGSTFEAEESDHVVLRRGHVRVRLDRQAFALFQESLASGADLTTGAKAAIGVVASLVAAAVDAQLSEEEKERLATELVEHAAALFPEAVVESRDNEKVVVRFGVGARTFHLPIVRLELAGYPRDERLEILETIIRARVGASMDPARSDRDLVRPRFKTPSRGQRVDALLQSVAAQHGVSLDDIERPPEITASFEGLPYPIDYVLD
ncbi:MAG: hypothetical protein ACI9KE_006551 [Polyangiales bacterium]|jgi:hypothetical protein